MDGYSGRMQLMLTHEITLTPNEAIYISDGLTSQSERGDNRDLLLKIGGALLELWPDGKAKPGMSVPVALFSSEMWMIRDIAKSAVNIGGEPVGLSLALKCYAGLIAIGGQSVVAETGLPIVAEVTYDNDTANDTDSNTDDAAGRVA